MTTVKELKQICKDLGLKGYSTLKKQELIKLIKDTDPNIKIPEKKKSTFQKFYFLEKGNEYVQQCKELEINTTNVPSLNKEHFWIFQEYKDTPETDEYSGKWMLFCSKNDLFYSSTIQNVLPWKCQKCQIQNKLEYEICSKCFEKKPEINKEKGYLTTSLDLQWFRTIKYTLNGQLGNVQAKVSTSCDGYCGTGVIIIYTKDSRDKEDVKKVAENICKYLNITRTICYKTDIATIMDEGPIYKYNPKTKEFIIY